MNERGRQNVEMQNRVLAAEKEIRETIQSDPEAPETQELKILLKQIERLERINWLRLYW